MSNANTILTADSHKLFMSLAYWAPHWNGQPIIDISPADRGNLTDLKRKGLIITVTDEGATHAIFTEAGIEYGVAHGIDRADIETDY